MAGNIGEYHIGGGGNDHRTDGKTIQAVGQVDGIGGTHNHKRCKYDVSPAQIRREPFKEWYRHLGGKIRAGVNQKTGNQGQTELQHELVAHIQTLAALFDLHQIVIDKSNKPVADNDKQHNPGKIVGQVAPQKHRCHNRKYNQQAAHCRRAGF
jgi:hypothetical protein